MAETHEIATLGAGCFWCVEAVFDDLKGVVSVESGYTGGKTVNPTYDDICNGDTGHAEVVRVTFDPAVVSYADILRVFFTVHDPTTLNRQGNDVGTQYRSVIQYFTEEQRRAAEGRATQPSEDQIKISRVLEAVADRKGTIITSVALAYVMHKAPYVFPIVGGRTVEHLRHNVEALTLELTAEDIREIEGAVPFDPGFPTNVLYRPDTHHFQQVFLLAMGGTFDYVPAQKPIAPPKGGE